jgi:glycosyltransferase involved in cell wall biosynthesis
MTGSACFPKKLVIVSHVVHYKSSGHLYAYAPYAREIQIWADMFDEVLIAAPCREQEPPGDCALLDRNNFSIAPQRELGGEALADKVKLLFSLPAVSWELARSIRQGDAVHVRCPGNLGLIGSILAPMFSKYLVAKFAGQWSSNPGESWSVRLQRAVLRSRWWHGPVTVYGRWPGQPSHVVPFFSAALSEEQMGRAEKAIERRRPSELRNILFVGRLSRAKNADILLQALSQLRAESIPFRATFAGEGPESSNLRKQTIDLGLSECVEFAGGVSSDRIIELLEHSGILVLASETEGWPKAIVEAMAFGLITIGSDIGLIPEIASEGRGLVVSPRDANLLTTALRQVLTAPEKYSGMRLRAAEWASHYSLESLRDSLRLLLAKHWGLSVEDQRKAEQPTSSRLPLSAGVK